MAQRTQKAIREGFISLLNEVPFEKITVLDIAARSNINRNTFYYYYGDIFALVEDVLQTETQHMTMAFLTMSMCEIFHSFNLRSQRNSVFRLYGQNPVLWAAMIGSLILTTAVLEIPFLANAFGFTPVGAAEYGIALCLAVLVIPVVEAVKHFQRRRIRQI